MTQEEITVAYSALPQDSQISFLVRLAHELTLQIRGYYSSIPQVVDSNTGSGIAVLNEIQHRVTNQLLHIILGHTECPSDKDFVESLYTWARHDLTKARLSKVLEHIYRQNSV